MDVLFMLNMCSKLEISTRMKLTYPLMGETVAFIIIRDEFRSNTAKKRYTTGLSGKETTT